ncbi:MAG: DUF2254 domain-containing protein [Propionivibrio sp.]
MRAQLLKYWERLHSSFWFLPSLMALAAVALSFITVAIDRTPSDGWLRSLKWGYGGGAEGASAVLQTIAGSMITIAGVVFSLTLVALSLASSQFGPRLLRNFMRDTTNQLVLGTFVATFLYCLLVLLQIRHPGEDAFVPSLSVSLGVGSSLANLWVLIYFIHHVSVSIQADEIIARVGGELLAGIDRLFPAHIGKAEPDDDETGAKDRLPPSFALNARTILSAGDGYLQLIDGESLLAIAIDRDLVVRIEYRPGQYVLRDTPLVTIFPAERGDDELAEQINTIFILGNQRTSTQDVEFIVEQLVEVASRALSPGINDPFTAIACVDRLGSALHRIAGRTLPSGRRFDDEGVLRVLAMPITYAQLADAAFNQIRQFARSNVAVTLRLLETIAKVAPAAHRPEERTTLQRHADMIVRGARAGFAEEEDRRAAEQRYLTASDRLAAGRQAVKLGEVG